MDNDTLTIANEFIAAVKTERSERGAGIGYWDQIRVFLNDQNAMQEWNWRHKDHQHLDKKDLGFNSIGNIQALKKGDKTVVTLKLVNNDGSRNVSFEFTDDKTKTSLEDGKIATKIAGPTETYARKEINKTLEHAWDMDEAQKIAKAGGVELTEDDYRKVVVNLLRIASDVEYIEKARKIAKAGGFEISKDDYKQFMFDNLTSFHSRPKKDIKVVDSLAKFQTSDFEEMIEHCLSHAPYGDRIYHAKIVAEYGKMSEDTFRKIAIAQISQGEFYGALELSETHNFKFTKEESQEIINGFLSMTDTWYILPAVLKKAQEVAKESGIEITKDDYKKFLDGCIEKMFRYEEIPKSFRNYPKDKLERIQMAAKIAGIDLDEKEKALPKWLTDVQKGELDEADNIYSFKPEMRSAKSRTGNKSYEKPEITESIVDEIKGYGVFVLKEQIDHDTRFPQMRYTLYFIDKSGNKKTIFEKHDYIDDGGGGSIYIKNDPSITEVQIVDKKIKFKVGGEAHEVSI